MSYRPAELRHPLFQTSVSQDNNLTIHIKSLLFYKPFHMSEKFMIRKTITVGVRSVFNGLTGLFNILTNIYVFIRDDIYT